MPIHLWHIHAASKSLLGKPWRTSDIHLEWLLAVLAAVGNLHNAADDFLIESAAQPALHESSVHERLLHQESVATSSRMGNSPKLQTQVLYQVADAHML